MRIIFLDIDGVLNSTMWMNSCARNDIDDVQTLMVDPVCVLLICQICKDLDAKIVITSSWRTGSLQSTMQELRQYKALVPLLEYVIGETPYRDRTAQSDNVHRGIEIKYWIELFEEDIDEYVIIDDDTDFLDEQSQHLVNVNPTYGFTMIDAIEVVRLFSEDVVQYFSKIHKISLKYLK